MSLRPSCIRWPPPHRSSDEWDRSRRFFGKPARSSIGRPGCHQRRGASDESYACISSLTASGLKRRIITEQCPIVVERGPFEGIGYLPAREAEGRFEVVLDS